MSPMAAVACVVEELTKAVDCQPKQPPSVRSLYSLLHSVGPGYFSSAAAPTRDHFAVAPAPTANASNAASAIHFTLESVLFSLISLSSCRECVSLRDLVRPRPFRERREANGRGRARSPPVWVGK